MKTNPFAERRREAAPRDDKTAPLAKRRGEASRTGKKEVRVAVAPAAQQQAEPSAHVKIASPTRNRLAKRRREAPHQGIKQKLLFVLMGAAVSAAAGAQVPDASIKLNLFANYLSEQPGRTTTRLYDTLGHLSTVGLRLRTDLGFQVYAAQKLQIIPHGGDPDQLDEYYVESPGNWIVGKQYLPFGQGSLLHESALAVSSSLFITALEMPVIVAACDAGPGRQLGVVARVGDHFGVSAAVGEHFGIAGTSFALIRLPTQAADVGRGFHAIYGVDFDSRQDEWEFRGEALVLRAPETSTDLTDVIADATVRYDPSPQRGFEFGITHSARERADFVRFQAFITPIAKVSIEPMIRFRNFELFDVSIALHVKF